jgi:hypothetical protein
MLFLVPFQETEHISGNSSVRSKQSMNHRQANATQLLEMRFFTPAIISSIAVHRKRSQASNAEIAQIALIASTKCRDP